MTTSTPSARAASIFARVAAPPLFLVTSNVDLLVTHQGDLILDAERSARQDQPVDGKPTDRRINRSHDVTMPRRRRKSGQLQAADGQENPPRPHAQRGRRRRHVGHAGPTVAIPRSMPAGSNRRAARANAAAGGNGVSRHLRGEWMGRIDHDIDLLIRQIRFQPLDAAKPADPERDRRQHRVPRPPGKRQHRLNVFAPSQIAAPAHSPPSCRPESASHLSAPRVPRP